MAGYLSTNSCSAVINSSCCLGFLRYCITDLGNFTSLQAGRILNFSSISNATTSRLPSGRCTFFKYCFNRINLKGHVCHNAFAIMRLPRLLTSSSSFIRFTSDAYMPPYFAFQLYNAASEMPCSRTSSFAVRPASF